MDNPGLKEIRRILRRHEEITQGKNSALMHISFKIIELEQANVTHTANIMNYTSPKTTNRYPKS
jgi:hypothetical protein